MIMNKFIVGVSESAALRTLQSSSLRGRIRELVSTLKTFVGL